jgi:protein translocase SEC61 complex gamma subunit
MDIKATWEEWKRVLRVTKKPDSVEFKAIVKASGLGMAVIGLIGFMIQMAREVLR